MERKFAIQLLAVLVLFGLMPFFMFPSGVTPPKVVAQEVTEFNPIGPWADEVVFQVIGGQDVQVAALRTGEIDVLSDMIDDAQIIAELEADPNIDVVQTQRKGFGHLTFNCQWYPQNFAGLRRAIAYAIDKYEFSNVMWGGFSQPLDSPIPANTPPWHDTEGEGEYYESNIEAARAALAADGFFDVTGDGLVEAPNGEPFSVRCAFHQEGTNWLPAWQAQTDELTAAGIPFELYPVDFNTYLDFMYQIPRQYQAICFGYSTGPTPLFLAEFRTELIAEPYGNIWNWSNETFDNVMDAMLAATTLEEALDLSIEAQRIFKYNCPLVVTYNNILMNGIRNDKWEGWINSPGAGVGTSNGWIPQIIKLQEGQEERTDIGTGGTFNALIAVAMDTQNVLMSTSSYGLYVLGQMYSGLIGDLHPLTWEEAMPGNGIAAGWDNVIVGDAWEFTIDLLTNATWHDGMPVTADDVVFSYNYIADNAIPNFVSSIPYFDSIERVDDDTVKIIASTDSYWAWYYLRNWYILPQHIWEGVANPATYTNPVPVGSGPYKWAERVEGEFVRLEFHAGYHRGVIGHEPAETAPVSYLGVYIAVGVLVIVVVLIGSVWYLRKK